MDENTDRIEVQFANGATAYVESAVYGEENVSLRPLEFDKLVDAIEGISLTVLSAVRKVRPTKATVEFGIEVGAESGQLTALIVKGTGKANLTITLEWEDDKARIPPTHVIETTTN